MLHNIKPLYLHCVFHGIRFKVNNEDWLSVMDSLFCFLLIVHIGFDAIADIQQTILSCDINIVFSSQPANSQGFATNRLLH